MTGCAVVIKYRYSQIDIMVLGRKTDWMDWIGLD